MIIIQVIFQALCIRTDLEAEATLNRRPLDVQSIDVMFEVTFILCGVHTPCTLPPFTIFVKYGHHL